MTFLKCKNINGISYSNCMDDATPPKIAVGR